MTVVQHLLTDDADAPASGYVTAQLIGAGLRPDTQSQVVAATAVRVDADGRWSRDLVPNNPGEFYRVSLAPDGGRPRSWDIRVHESESPLWLGDLLFTAPAPEGSPLAGYLQGASAYEIAVKYGYDKSEAEWLATLGGGDATGGPVTSSAIVDASAVGRSVLTAGTQAAARSAIDAGDGTWAGLVGKPTIPADQSATIASLVQRVQALENAGTTTPPGGTTPPADTTAPTVPTGVSATANSATQATVVWAVSTDAVGVASYRVRRNGADLAGAEALTGTSFTDTTVSASTNYSYTVSAVDAAGNRSAESEAALTMTPAAPATTLANLSGKTVWLRGDSAPTTTTGAPVSAWDDRSSNNADAVNATVGEQPTYIADPMPGAVFDGSRKMLASPASASLTSETLFVVCRPSDVAGFRALRGATGEGASGGHVLLLINGKLTLSRQGIGDTVAGASILPAGQVVVLAMDVSPTAARLYVNGTLEASVANPPTPTGGRTTLIGAGYNGGDNFAGTIYEVVSVPRVLTDADRTAVVNELKGRYSVGVTVADVTAPTISSFTATPGDRTADLAWAGSDNVGITRWTVTRNGVTVYDGTGTSVSLTGLTNGTAYTWTLTAYDAAGNTRTTTASATPAASVVTSPGTTPTSSGTSTPARWQINAGGAPHCRVTWETGVDSGTTRVFWVGSFPDVRARTSKLETEVAAQLQAGWQAWIVDTTTGGTVADSGVQTGTAEAWAATGFAAIAGRAYLGYARVRAADGQWSPGASTRFVAPTGVIRYFEDFGAVGDGGTGDLNTAANNYIGPVRAAIRAANPGDVVRSKNPGTVLVAAASGTTLTAVTGTFTPSMVGRKVMIYGAGVFDASGDSATHRTTITAVAGDGRAATLAAPVRTATIASQTVIGYPEYRIGHTDIDGGLGGVNAGRGGVTVDGTGCLFTSTDPDSAGFRTTLPGMTYRNVHYWTRSSHTRGNGLNNNTGPFFIESTGAVGIRLIGCYAEHARDAGFLIYGGPSDVHVVDAWTDHCMADPFHVTGSANNIQWIRCTAVWAGDDVVANIGYRSDGDPARPYNITWESPRMIGQDWGRGLSFGGCRDVLATDITFDGGAMASFIIGSDGDMANTSHVQIRRFTITKPHTRYNARPTYTQGTGTGSVITDGVWLKLLNSGSPTPQRDILIEDGTVLDGWGLQVISYGGGTFDDASVVLRGIAMTGTTNAGAGWRDDSTYPGRIDLRGITVPSGSTPAVAPANVTS